jgi:hypothetical protein
MGLTLRVHVDQELLKKERRRRLGREGNCTGLSLALVERRDSKVEYETVDEGNLVLGVGGVRLVHRDELLLQGCREVGRCAALQELVERGTEVGGREGGSVVAQDLRRLADLGQELKPESWLERVGKLQGGRDGERAEDEVVELDRLDGDDVAERVRSLREDCERRASVPRRGSSERS